MTSNYSRNNDQNDGELLKIKVIEGVVQTQE